MKLPILQAPDQRLRAMARTVDFDDFPTIEVHLPLTVQDLRDTFGATEDCLGLAAPQLGLDLRIIIVDITSNRCDTRLMVNPIIVKASADLQRVRDGCMSINFGRTHEYTKRPKRIEVEWRDERGGKHQQKFHGLSAACVRHEVDHLDGKLFTDQLP